MKKQNNKTMTMKYNHEKLPDTPWHLQSSSSFSVATFIPISVLYLTIALSPSPFFFICRNFLVNFLANLELSLHPPHCQLAPSGSFPGSPHLQPGKWPSEHALATEYATAEEAKEYMNAVSLYNFLKKKSRLEQFHWSYLKREIKISNQPKSKIFELTWTGSGTAQSTGSSHEGVFSPALYVSSTACSGVWAVLATDMILFVKVVRWWYWRKPKPRKTFSGIWE